MPRVLLFAAALIALSSCAASNPPSTVTTAPIAGFVTDLSVFDAFIATQPTPEQFRAHYPDVTLALPGSINTKELRTNHSRYFAETSAEGRITGGKFQ